jgi:glycerophosphoryl diester phosphodiesterase
MAMMVTSTAGIVFSTEGEFASVANHDAVARSTALIIYNSNDGSLYYNQNVAAEGFGTGGQFAVIDSKPNLTAQNFSIV